jgi:hypothetical protein
MIGHFKKAFKVGDFLSARNTPQQLAQSCKTGVGSGQLAFGTRKSMQIWSTKAVSTTCKEACPLLFVRQTRTMLPKRPLVFWHKLLLGENFLSLEIF